MSNTALGASLTINNDVLNKITEAEARIKRLEETTRTSSDKITKSFRSMGDLGVQYFIDKLKLAQRELGKTNMPNMDFSKKMNFGQASQQATNVASSVTKIAVAINKISGIDDKINPKNSVLAWQGLQKNIEQIDKRQQDLIKTTRNYESTLSRIQSGKGGVLTKDMQDQYKAAQSELSANKKLIESYRQKQQAIINYQAEQRKQLQNAQAIRNLELQNTSLPEQRKADELRRMNEYYRQLEKTSRQQANEAVKAANKEAAARKQAEAAARKQANEAIATARRVYNEQAKLYQQQNQKKNTTYDGSLSFAKSASTINRRTKAIQYLTQARAQLSTTDANYAQKLKALNDAIKRMNAENDRAVRGARRLQEQHGNLMNTSDQLARKLALIFSVSQIQGYVNKLIQVRGEFELQNTALASILQNKDKADKLFGQITELAVKSPFTVKELTTYTKSLAAYQFQYEELYDTTKRLADVASGLGVDMQRLILAVGQVKAAGYLRGTETRQFTEAGFNILGELAKYYSELENRIVSVGEVQERQFKRMIAFQDVEEVFKRVTSAGGMFYQMQEKQAETLAGQMSNLKDSIDLMLNSIGKANDGTLKDMVALVRSIIENWRDVQTAMNVMIAMFSPYIAYMTLAKIASSKFALNLLNIAINNKKVTKTLDVVNNKIATLSTKMHLGARGAKVMTTALGGLATLGIGAAISGIIMGITYLYVEMTKASRKAEELKKSLKDIASEGFIRSAELSRSFETLANKAVAAADGSKEQQLALEELQRTYKNIVPEEQLRIKNLRALKGEYESVTTAIYSKVQADIKEKQLQEVGNTYGKDFADSLSALAVRLSKYNISLEKSRVITDEFRKELEKGMITTSKTAKKYLEDLILKTTEAKVTLTDKGFVDTAGGKTWGDIVIKEIGDVLDSYIDFSYEVDKINGKPIQFFNVKATPLYSELKPQLEDIVKFKEQWDEQNKDKFSLKVEFNEQSKNALIAKYQEFIQDIQSQISSGKIWQKDIVSANLIIEEAQSAIKKLDITPQIAQVNDLRVEFSKLYNIDFEKLNFTKMLEGQGFNDFIKRLDEGIEGYKDVIKIFDEATRQKTEVPAMQQWALLQGKTIEEVRALVPALEEYRKALALVIDDDKKKGGKDNTLQIFKQRLEFFERANREYKKLLKNYSEEEARVKVIASLMDEAEQRGVGGIFISAQFDEQGTLDSLNKVKAMYQSLSQEMRIAFAKAFGGVELDMDVEIRQDRIKTLQSQFESLFGNYEMSLELDKLGLDKGLMSQLFGVDIFDLDGLKQAVEPFKNELQNTLGKDGISAWDAMNKKIEDAEAKSLQERLKTYSQYLKKSVSERVAIEIEAQKKIAEVRNTKEFTPEQQERIVTQIRQETQAKKDEQSWKEFQNSELYIKMFEDLEFASTKALETMEQKLVNIRGYLKKLSPTELRQINEQLEKIRSERISRNPFEGLTDNIKGYIEYLKKADKLNQQFIDSQSKQEGLSKLYDNQSRLRNEIEAQYVTEVKLNGENSRKAILLKEDLKQQDEILDVTLKQLIAQGKITKEIANQIREGERLGSNAQKQINNIGSTGSQVVNSVGELTDMLSNFSIDFGESFSGVLSGIGQAFQGLEKIDLTKPMSIVSGAVSVFSGIGNAIASLFGGGDRKKEKGIQRQIKLVENLQKSYEKLEKAIEDAYSINTLKASNNQAVENLQAQNDALRKSIAAEKDKKKKDKDRIKEWEETIEDNLNRIKELQEQFYADLGGFGSEANVQSAAQEFADAWLEAYMETGNGLDALTDKWDEYIKHVISKQLMLKGTEKYLKPVMDMLDKTLEDAEFTPQEAEALQEKINAIMPQLNEFWKSIADSFNLESMNKGDTMSGLSRGIQSVTEETAQVLESLLNSVRYFSADSNMQLKNIYNILIAPPLENPFYSELRAQTEQLRMINSLWSSIVKNVGVSGKAMNVRIV